ncbi:MAG: hotdog domain-containing protein [Eubacteriales bacterium]|nr:hotdog domain-containing protein [Eubacteriales bacterium]
MENKTGHSEETVSQALTARAMGSGALEVFATPAMAALMEKAACAALEGTLPEGITTVGTYLEVNHTAATPLGMRVWADAQLTETDGRNYCFSIVAYDEAGEIGRAAHRRASVKAQRFLEKAQEKNK